MMGLSHDSIERHQLLADATQMFIDIDTDHSGTLSYEEVFSALENLGKRVFGTGYPRMQTTIKTSSPLCHKKAETNTKVTKHTTPR